MSRTIFSKNHRKSYKINIFMLYLRRICFLKLENRDEWPRKEVKNQQWTVSRKRLKSRKIYLTSRHQDAKLSACWERYCHWTYRKIAAKPRYDGIYKQLKVYFFLSWWLELVHFLLFRLEGRVSYFDSLVYQCPVSRVECTRVVKMARVVGINVIVTSGKIVYFKWKGWVD